jgi:hypothetical protein
MRRNESGANRIGGRYPQVSAGTAAVVRPTRFPVSLTPNRPPEVESKHV